MKASKMKSLLEALDGDEEVCIEKEVHKQFEGWSKELVVVTGFEWKDGKVIFKI